MGKLSILGLKIILAVATAGALFVQFGMIPMIIFNDSPGTGAERLVSGSFLAYLFIAGLIIEACVYCVWKLATRVRRGTVFDPASLRYVSPIIFAFVIGALATFTVAAIFASSSEIAPGIVLLIGGAGVLMIGISFIALVLRHLLEQAAQLRTELGEVI
ncbi:DUF2975 domain-containing protein [Glutamicibacter sp. AOP5-A2-18]|uniref:DUF2975 domain-containing protein n=1 Tax=Glutamicibacter sp. AOP5-A2-18 TaxID=3457656 RepID=UPI004033D745